MNNVTTLPEGWLTQPECDALLEWAGKTSGDIVEIGSYKGRSALALVSLGRTVWCVDPWDDYLGERGDQILKAFCKNTKGKNIMLTRMRVEDWAPREAGFVYIDGDHSIEGTQRAIEKALQCAPVYVAGHDIYNADTGLVLRRLFEQYFGEAVAHAEKMAIFKV